MGRGTVSHVSMCIFQTFQWEFGKQHPLGCQLGPPSPGVPHLVSIGLILMAVPSPPFGSALFPGIPYPSPSGLASCCHKSDKEVPAVSSPCSGVTEQCQTLPSTPISGWTHGACSQSGQPSSPPALENLSAPGSLGSLNWSSPLSAPAASSCALPSDFCIPISRGPVAGW